uniref:THD domain-containing protein n=1 Tax=Clastoptera arizonana TaxID=38151 RepID=A0A1B6CP16_9HEMI
MVSCSNVSKKIDSKCKKCVEVHKMTVDLPPLHITIPKSRSKLKQGTINSKTSININPKDFFLPKDIDLQLNTNVSLESKCKKYNIKTFCIFILFLEFGLLHFYFQKLSSELQTNEKLISEINSRVNCLVASNLNLRESLRKVQNNFKTLYKGTGLNRRHSMYRRDLTNQSKQSVIGNIEEYKPYYEANTSELASVHNGSARNERAVPARGPLLAHFKGALPEAVIQDGGIIAPWYVDIPSSKEHLLNNLILLEGRGKIEILEKGLYFIYAQVYYLTTEALNSFSIHVEEAGRRETVLATCSTVSKTVNLSEVSCYTAIAHYLMPGDRIFILQRERNRRIVFRNGQTFFGVTMLNPGKTTYQ